MQPSRTASLKKVAHVVGLYLIQTTVASLKRVAHMVGLYQTTFWRPNGFSIHAY